MDYKNLDSAISVSPQISAADIPAIISAGFRSIVCNRPNEEEDGQPTYESVEAAAKSAGLPIVNIPVVSGRITRQNMIDMKKAMDELPKPVFAYCRSGARCANLYAMLDDLDD